MTLNVSCFFCSLTKLGPLDGPDIWENGWVYFGEERHQRLQRQQQSEGVVLWACVIGDRLVGPVSVPEFFKVFAAAYYL